MTLWSGTHSHTNVDRDLLLQSQSLNVWVCLPLQVPLCQYREAIFKVGIQRRLSEEVQAELRAISDAIKERNSQQVLPYPYLSPSLIENSVAI